MESESGSLFAGFKTNTYFIINFPSAVEKELQNARRALEMSIVSARAQMEVSILSYPRSILMTKMEDFTNQTPAPNPITSKNDKESHAHPTTIPQTNKRPRIAKPGEVVYSARGSPIMIQRLFGGGEVMSSDDDDDEPSFDTASDKSVTSESFSLPDEAAYTKQVMEEEERKKILSSEGAFPRSSSMFHRSSSS